MKVRTKREPLTAVHESETMSWDEIERKVMATLTGNTKLLSEYASLWYGAGHTWNLSSFLGVPMMKGPNDLWMYQELIARHRPKTIIETGTYKGGSALWFATILDALQSDARIYTIDIHDRRASPTPIHPRVTFIQNDSADPALAKRLAKQIRYPLLVVLDSDHSEVHVRDELDLYAQLVDPGGWVVVEDTNISWDADRGARGAVETYLTTHAGEWRQSLLYERYLLTMHPGGWLQRVKGCDGHETKQRRVGLSGVRGGKR